MSQHIQHTPFVAGRYIEGMPVISPAPEGVKYFLSESRRIMGMLMQQAGVAVVAPQNVGKSKLLTELQIVGEQEFDRPVLPIDGHKVTTPHEIDQTLKDIHGFSSEHGQRGVITFDHIDDLVESGSDQARNQARVTLLEAILPRQDQNHTDMPGIVVATTGRQEEILKGATTADATPNILDSFDSEQQTFHFLGLIQPQAAVMMLRRRKTLSRADIYAAMEAVFDAKRCDYATVKRIAETGSWEFLQQEQTATPTNAETAVTAVGQSDEQSAEQDHTKLFVTQLVERGEAIMDEFAMNVASKRFKSLHHAPGAEEALQAAGNRLAQRVGGSKSSKRFGRA